MKKLLGISMLVSLFLSIFIFITYDTSFLSACKVTGIVIALVALVFIAVGLIVEE